MTQKTPTGESPYSLPLVLSCPPFRGGLPEAEIENFTPEASQTGLRENLNMLEERRAMAHLKNLHYQEAGRLLLGGGAIVERLIKVHLDVGIFWTLSEGVQLDHNVRVLPPKLLEHHPVPELVADLPHLLKARFKSSGCLIGGYHLLALGLQFSFEESCCQVQSSSSRSRPPALSLVAQQPRLTPGRRYPSAPCSQPEEPKSSRVGSELVGPHHGSDR
ncbi:hypothetical protein BHM03_00008992 [Ensete ventricosum]|nr:hypothetical protein BHM03_00008992 [Ensete ventricosum]